MRPLALVAALAALAPAARAEAPRVLADTAPVHSLAAAVMAGAGEPGLIVPPGTTPHDAALPPSEARARTEADLVIWTGLDPHAWLDPAVAAAWGATAAEALAERPGALRVGLHARLAPLAGRGYAVGHDATQYFERAAGLPAAWAVAHADGASPASSDAAALREAVLAGEVACLMLDAESDPAWAAPLSEGTAMRVAMADPDGVALAPGPDPHPRLVADLAAALEGGLAPRGPPLNERGPAPPLGGPGRASLVTFPLSRPGARGRPAGIPATRLRRAGASPCR